MKYLRVEKRKDGKKKYVFSPPKKAIEDGVVSRVVFESGRQARYEAPRLLEKVEEWHKGNIKVGNVGPKSPLSSLYDYYINSENFRVLSHSTQKHYTYAMSSLLLTKAKRVKTLGEIKISELTAILCSEIYSTWVNDKGIAYANKNARLFSVLINYAWSLDLINTNPMAKVKKLKHTPRSQIWTDDQVEKFLSTAFGNFRWRSIGLLALLCYEWAQRPNDIARLKWDAVDLLRGSVTITQTKRGATVYLPLAKHLEPVLKQQSEELGFQRWVLPDINRPTGGYEPMTAETQSVLAREVKKVAGLPQELKLGDLRKSAITEMVSSGVPTTMIMSVTGHKSIQSLNPYLKNTLESATSALDMRKGKKK